ncbi:MAG TPA: phosphopantetheine-binding protein [Chthoniobacterales bacterium]
MGDDELKSQIRQVMIEHLMLKLTPEEIGSTTPLFSPEGLALDSIDALELAVAIEKHFGVSIPNAETARGAFQNVDSLAAFIQKNRA